MSENIVVADSQSACLFKQHLRCLTLLFLFIREFGLTGNNRRLEKRQTRELNNISHFFFMV
jgi:hypothetical protein